jgi:hypothetical protein
LPLQQQDEPGAAWPVQKGLIVPSGQRQVKCGVLPRSDETAVAQTSKAVAVLRNRRMASPHFFHYPGGGRAFQDRN